MKTIAIVNEKGGVAKTTTAASLGAALARSGKRVLLIDLDAQRSLTTFLCAGPDVRTIYSSIMEQTPIETVMLASGAELCPASENLTVIGSQLEGVAGREDRLKTLLQDLSYDYALIDCPPSTQLLTVMALTAATHVIIPLKPEALPVEGLLSMLDKIDLARKELNPGLQLGGILLTMCQRKKIHRLMEETLRANLGGLVFTTKIRDNTDVSEAPYKHQDIFEYSPKCNGVADYAALAAEVIEKLK